MPVLVKQVLSFGSSNSLLGEERIPVPGEGEVTLAVPAAFQDAKDSTITWQFQFWGDGILVSESPSLSFDLETREPNENNEIVVKSWFWMTKKYPDPQPYLAPGITIGTFLVDQNQFAPRTAIATINDDKAAPGQTFVNTEGSAATIMPVTWFLDRFGGSKNTEILIYGHRFLGWRMLWNNMGIPIGTNLSVPQLEIPLGKGGIALALYEGIVTEFSMDVPRPKWIIPGKYKEALKDVLPPEVYDRYVAGPAKPFPK